MKHPAILLLLCLAGLAGCEKDPRYMSPQKYLSQAPWKLTFSQAFTEEAGRPTDTTDYFAQMDSCQQDRLYVFAEDESYYATPGARKCPGQDLNRQDLGRWRYNAVEKQLITDGNGRLIWNVVQLNDSVLWLQLSYTAQDSARSVRRTEERRYVHP